MASICALATGLFLALSVRAQDAAYGAYGHYPVGSTRVLAMGGAFNGLADDASSVVTNPAGLGLTQYTFDLTGGENRIINRETYFGTSQEQTAIPYTSRFRAGALRLGPLGFGGGYGNSYAVDHYDSTTRYRRSLLLESYDAAVALSFAQTFSIGATAHFEKASLFMRDPQGNEFVSRADGVYPRVGILVNLDRKASAGISYTPERRYNLDENAAAEALPGAPEWFHDIVVPARVALGLSAKISQKLRGVGDIDIYMPVSNAISVGGTVADPADQILSQQQTVIHGGFEFTVLKQKDLEFVWRGGGYNEPKRLESSSNRLHYTMGVEVRFLFVVFAASYDQASGYSNLAQSVSISLGAI